MTIVTNAEVLPSSLTTYLQKTYSAAVLLWVMHVHSVKLLHQNQWVSVQDQFQTPRSVESFHEVTEPEQPRLFPCLLICPGYMGKLRQTSSRWEVTAHKLQHANPFHRCSHLGAKWFKVIEVPCHPWQDLFTFPVGGCGLMLQNGQQRYTSLREISPVKRTKQNLVKKKKNCLILHPDQFINFIHNEVTQTACQKLSFFR